MDKRTVIFIGEEKYWENKLNVVDTNNVLVGYDYSADCCEVFGWFIDKVEHDNVPERSMPNPPQDSEGRYILEGYVFDPQFFKATGTDKHRWDDVEGLAIFKLVHDSMVPLYLHLYNMHNGYYSHGFWMQDGEDTIRRGSL